ncbi:MULTISPECIES: SAF domain-containing protein [Rhodococcus erythropolis group]|uniref:SAF domain-containing protein n=1 Tax=Rhodococcus baikonurensis TaxID=172041 RepID=A0ABV5XFY0_9NOCA|nr:SAF domain-containing protein [Rhodococcus qingshengii]MBP1054097.1 SAF domain-containing protein [Rhodococcus qingshengii]
MVFEKLRTTAKSKAIGEDIDPDNPTTRRGSDFTATSRTKVRRRPIFLAAGIALVVVFVIGAVALVNGMRQVTNVLVVSHDIAQGQQITSQDLTTKQVNADAGIASVAVEDKASVVGQAAAVPIPSGTVLNPNAVTTAVIPGKGLTLVGVTVSYSKLPAEPLRAGDQVRIVDTPRDQDDSPVQGPITSKAQVVSTKFIPETSETTVDVLVQADEASWVSARAATRRVAIVLDPREK